MGNRNIFPLVSQTARKEHICYFCNNVIASGEPVYRQKDPEGFVSIISKKFCKACFDAYGQKLKTAKGCKSAMIESKMIKK